MADPLVLIDQLQPDDKREKTEAVTHFSCRKCVKLAYLSGYNNALNEIINELRGIPNQNPAIANRRPSPLPGTTTPIRPGPTTPNLPQNPPPGGIGIGLGWVSEMTTADRDGLAAAIAAYQFQVNTDPGFQLLLQHEREGSNSVRTNALTAGACCRRKTLTQRNEPRKDEVKPFSRPRR